MTSLPFTPATWGLLHSAREEAVRLGAEAVGARHLLPGLFRVDDDTVRRAVAALGAPEDAIGRAVAETTTPANGPAPRPLPLAADAEAALEAAQSVARAMGADAVDAEHALLGLLKAGRGALQALEKAGVAVDAARGRVLDALRIPPALRVELGTPAPRSSEAADALARSIEEAREDREAEEDLVLEALPAKELTRGALPEGFELVGRDRTLDKFAELLDREERTSLFLIGPPGSGRRTLIRAYARRLMQRASPGLPRRQVYLFEPSLARRAAPPVFAGEGAVVARWLSEVLARAESGVFAFSEFVADEWVYDDFIEFVVPAVERRWAECVFAVTPQERRELGRRHPPLNAVTLDVELSPLSREDARAVAAARARAWPASEAVSIADTALDAVANLAAKFVTDLALPGSALEVLDRTRRRVRGEYAPHLEEQERSIDAVQHRIREAVERGEFDAAARLRAERDRLLKDYDARLEKLQASRAEVVIGTGEVVRTVAEMTGRPEAEIRAGGVWG